MTGSWSVMVFLTLYAACDVTSQRSAENSIENVQGNFSRFREFGTRVTCSFREFRCKNGQCIRSELLCDGAASCTDGSDETAAECEHNPPCGPRAFRCNYGACVDGDSRCNNIVNCVDGSDEVGCPRKNTQTSTGCKSNQYRCKNGQCISGTEVCDGSVNCRDRSDESLDSCRDFECPTYAFRCRYGGCIDTNKGCNGEINCADGSDEDYELCGRRQPPTRPTSPRPPAIKETCEFPSQPENGEWKLAKSLCPGQQRDCKPSTGMRQADPGTNLVFRCYAGYVLNGTKDVFCGLQGKWSAIPKCVEIKCPPLSSAAVEARCSIDNSWVSCDNPAPIRTVAQLSCRNSYVPDTTDITRRETVRCNAKGEWEPNPIKCVSVCGVPSTGNGTPLIVNGTSARIAEFPWHATLYKAKNNEKQFICGATIIRDNLLVTAAHCVFDEVNKNVETPSKFYIAAGNVFRDYDFELHDPRTVRKTRVKGIYVVCNYLGLEGNYASDIAIIEVETSFTFSSIVMPICLDTSTAGDLAALEVPNEGKVAGFGRTDKGESSFILQTLTVPYVPLNTCKSSSIASESVRYITIDKFCAGYTNGSSVCDGDSGGGLVFKTDNKWYLRGIVSVGIGSTKNGAVRTCDSNAYSLYTRVSSHMEWIQDVILRVETKRPMRSCS